MDLDDQINQAVMRFELGDSSPETLGLLRNLIDMDASPRLVAAFFARKQIDIPDICHAAVQVLRVLETIGKASYPIACVLMAALIPLVSDVVGCHDVGDGASFWLFDLEWAQRHVQKLAAT